MPWSLANFFFSMHADQVVNNHVFWLFQVFVGVAVLCTMSFAAAHGVRYSPLLALAIVGGGVLTFNRWIEGATPPTWMGPAIGACALISVFILTRHFIREVPRRAS